MKQKHRLRKIIIAAILFIAAYFVPDFPEMRFAMFAAAYLLVGLEIIQKALRNIFHGQVFDENFLMSVATLGAFALGDYAEGVAVMLFYQVGEYFQSYAVAKSRKSIAGLMDIRPDYANIKKGGKIIKASPEEVTAGDVIVIRPGEKIPLDGTVTGGTSLIDTSAITGESLPREVGEGDEVISGCINLNGVIEVVVSRPYGESTVVKILDLVENASSQKAKVERFITRFARWYTPVVVIAAVAIAFLPPLLFAGETFRDWIYRALTFLVISCPCALVISVPLSFFGGIGAASRQGILVKGSNYLQALAETEIVVFDKTGTLTKGSFSVVKVEGCGLPAPQVLELAAYAGAHSSHPVSQSVRRAYGKEIDNSKIADFKEFPGRGVSARVNGIEVSLGNARLMEQIKADAYKGKLPGTILNLAVDGKFSGWIQIADEVKSDALQAVKELKAAAVRQIVMLTGDNKTAGQAVAEELGLDEVHCELLPAQKVEKMEQLLAEKSGQGKLVFVGDGINDAPVLARADIGIAMGGIGSDAAVEAADIVIMTDEPSKIAVAVRISRKTLRIVRQNIAFALGVKAIVLLLGVMGMATMWEAVFADVGVSVIAILNSLRALSIKK